jgi:hypothetical protein
MKKPKKVKYIVNEHFSGTRKLEDVFSDVFMSERIKSASFTLEKGDGTIKIPTVNSICVVHERSQNGTTN